MIRLRWYNPILDPACFETFQVETRAAIDDGTYPGGGPLEEPNEEHPANLISSLCDDDLHRPILDIDLPIEITPSSTEGHCHLSFPTVALTWEQYVPLLDALAAAGIIEPGWVEASKRDGQTLVRTPDCKRIAPRATCRVVLVGASLHDSAPEPLNSNPADVTSGDAKPFAAQGEEPW